MNKQVISSKIRFLGLALIFLVVFGAGASGTAGTRKIQVLTKERIEARAVEFLKQRLPWDPEFTDVTVNYKGDNLVLPRGRLSLNYRMPGKTRQVGKIPLALNIKVNNEFKRRLRLSAFVTVTVDQVRIRRAIRRGTILTRDDVEIEQVQSDRLTRGAVTRLEDAVGYEAVRNLEAGSILSMKMLRRPALVKKGARVLLVVEKGALKITAPGIAKQKGFKDSMVEALNTVSKKTVYGRVVDANTVLVQF